MASDPNRELPAFLWQGKYGEVKITEENVESSYTSGVLHNDDGKKEACIRFIYQILGVDNCLRFLSSAKERIRDGGFLVTVRDFVLKRISEVKSRPEFLNLTPETIETLLVPITIVEENADEQALVYSPSELFVSLYEWMSSNPPQRMIKFDEILEKFPIDTVDVDALETIVADEELQHYPRIRKKFFDAILKKCRKDSQPHFKISTVETEVEEQTDRVHALNHSGSEQVREASTSTAVHQEEDLSERGASFSEVQTATDVANHNHQKVQSLSTLTSTGTEGHVSELESLLVSKSTVPVPSVVGSTADFEIIPSPTGNDDPNVISLKEMLGNHSKDMPGVKMEAQVTTDSSASLHSASKSGGVASTEGASNADAVASVLERSSSDPTLPVPGTALSFQIHSTPERNDHAVKTIIVDEYLPTDWLSEVMPKAHPYFPQIGDELVYLRQFHQDYMKKISKSRAYPITGDSAASLPYKQNPDLPFEVPVKLVNIVFKNFPPRVAILTLERMGSWDSGKPNGGSLVVHYHGLSNMTDFLVLRVVYDYALSRGWKNRDRKNLFRSEELVAVMRKILPRNSERQKIESRRIASLLDFILNLPTAAQFKAPHAPEFDDYIDYPMDLSIIKARLDNLFYRRNQAILTDVDQLARNAVKIFPPDVAERVSVFSRLIQDVVSDVRMTQETLEIRYTQLCHAEGGIIPDLRECNDSAGVGKSRMNGTPASVQLQNVLLTGAVHNVKKSVKRDRCNGSEAQSHALNKILITSKSLSIPSRHSNISNGFKQLLKKKRDADFKKACHYCRFCDYSNKHRQIVKDHEHSHTGERPYSCADCLRTYRYKRGLAAHRSTCKVRKMAGTNAQ